MASEVLAATAMLAQDRAWLGAAEKRIAEGKPAVRATGEAVDQFVDLFTQVGGLMAERVTDLRDIRDRVVAELSGLPEPGVPVPAEPSILCAEDLAPADTAGLDPALVVGLATTLGGPTSHTAIIARQLGIPCVVAVNGLDDVPAGTPVLIDGTRGSVTLSPDPAEAQAAVRAADELLAAMAGWTGPGATADGHPVAILANVQDGSAARAAWRRPRPRASACSAPNCASSTATPNPPSRSRPRSTPRCSRPSKAAKVVIRTLDAGSDKPLKFVGHPDEANPALGVRGIRIADGNPALLTHQLEAIAGAAAGPAPRPG